MRLYAVYKLAFQGGRFDIAAVADELNDSELAGWIAFGSLEGWFPPDEKPTKAMTPDEAMRYFSGNKNYTHARIQVDR